MSVWTEWVGLASAVFGLVVGLWFALWPERVVARAAWRASDPRTVRWFGIVLAVMFGLILLLRLYDLFAELRP